MNDTVRDDIFMDTSGMRGNGYGIYSSSSSDMYHGDHHYHPYRRSDMGYFPNELKKSKPLTFHGDLKNSEDAEAWLLKMMKFIELHDYTENMKAKIAIFSLKGKEDIWWEDVKQVRDIRMKELSWHEYNIIFRKKYLSERYYDSKAKEFYELKMGSIMKENNMTKFLELLRYVL